VNRDGDSFDESGRNCPIDPDGRLDRLAGSSASNEWVQPLEHLRGLIHHVARSRVDQEADLWDVVQLVMIELNHFLRRGGVIRTTIERLACAITLNTVRKLGREKGRAAHVSLDGGPEAETDRGLGRAALDPEQAVEEDPMAYAVRQELRARIARACRDLTPAQLQLVIRHHVDGATVPELAHECGRTEAAIRCSLFRSRELLKSKLERD
jgi:RNA polymerase sigma factor (sigma-70 family)